jgi:hypothetical protein
VNVLPDRVFTPLGFDDNDNVQVVLDGTLADTCFKLGPTQVHVDHEAHKIVLRQQAYYYPGGWCAEVRIPYAQTVDLGIMQAGQYQVLLERPDHSLVEAASLPIAIATTSSPDDFLYAPVTEVTIAHRNTTEGGESKADVTLTLGGTFASSCMTFHEAKVNVRPNNVIEVLPIVDLRRGVDCATVATEFSVPVSIKGVAHGRYLFHVRSLNGQSVNRVVDL